MKKFVFLTLFILVSSAIFSQDAAPNVGGFIGSFGFGAAIPVGPINVGWRAGLHLDANAGYIFTNNIAARFDAAFSVLRLDAGDPYSRGKYNIVSLRGELLLGNFKKNREFLPYVIAGAGAFYKNRDELYYDDQFDEPGGSETEFGVVVGAGASFRFNKKYSLFAEINYNQGFGSQPVASFIPITVGIMMTP